MNTNKRIYITLICVVTAIAYFGWKFSARGAYESAEYTVLESDGSFEIREYPDLMMATTSMQFAAQGQDGSFMRLFRYISGANDADQKVAMTTVNLRDTILRGPPAHCAATKCLFVCISEITAAAPVASSGFKAQDHLYVSP